METLQSLLRRVIPVPPEPAAPPPAVEAQPPPPTMAARVLDAFPAPLAGLPPLARRASAVVLGGIASSEDLLAVSLLALAAAVAVWLAWRILAVLFAPYRKTWIAPRTRPKRYPKAVLDALPPPFPNGWYRLALADDVKVGELRQIDICGKTLALARLPDRDGKVFRAFDATCPHLGANLTEGRIKDGCVECPFHGGSEYCTTPRAV